MSPSPSPSPQPPSKKRKRTTTTTTTPLEIDLSLPEPPSRAASRRAKKQRRLTTATAAAAASPPPPTTQPNTKHAPKKPERSPHSIWIGNLPWSADMRTLRAFLIEKAGGAISEQGITRVHMPAAAAAGGTGAAKARNKGFAYVDFAGGGEMAAAMGLSETAFAGRRVLVKDAASFEGRPVEHGGVVGKGKGKGMAEAGRRTREESDRVFVGNLGFEVEKEELRRHFEACGVVVDVFMATFEDSGKCKGFAWVTFGSVEAARGAVRGWVRVGDGDDGSDGDEAEGDEESEAEMKGKGKGKKGKGMKRVYVNRLRGRTLRCEFAESSSERYVKRYRGAKGKNIGGGKGEGKGKGTGTGTGKGKGDEAEDDETERPATRKSTLAKGQGRRIVFDD